jgi:hypothetical protein
VAAALFHEKDHAEQAKIAGENSRLSVCVSHSVAESLSPADAPSVVVTH